MFLFKKAVAVFFFKFFTVYWLNHNFWWHEGRAITNDWFGATLPFLNLCDSAEDFWFFFSRYKTKNENYFTWNVDVRWWITPVFVIIFLLSTVFFLLRSPNLGSAKGCGSYLPDCWIFSTFPRRSAQPLPSSRAPYPKFTEKRFCKLRWKRSNFSNYCWKHWCTLSSF